MTSTTLERPRAKADAGDGLWPYWVSSPPRLEGEQRPAWESHHGGNDWHGPRAARLMYNVDEPLFPWQNTTISRAMATRDDGLWSHPDVVLVITRQQGKTQLVVARILYGLFKLGEKIVYTAQRWSTVKDVYNRLVEIIDRTPSLRARLAAEPSAASNHGHIETTNGGVLEMGPRTKAIGRGETKIDLAIFDEAYDIKDTHTGDLTGAQKAANNPQTWFISTAAVQSEHPNCSTFSTMRYNAMRGEPDTYGAEWSAPKSLKRDNPEAWRLAQPSHGVTVRQREVGAELRRANTPRLRALFEADYLGWGDWPPDEVEAEPLIPGWGGLIDRAPILDGQVVLAVERTPDCKVWCIAAGRRTVEGRVFVEVGYLRAVNIGVFGAYLLQRVNAWNPAAVVIDDHSTAKPIVSYMLKQGIELEVTNTPQLAAATQGIIDGAAADDVRHGDQPVLNDAVADAMTRDLPRGSKVWHDVNGGLTPLKAVTLAYDGVLRFAEDDSPTAAPSTGDEAAAGFEPVDLDVHDASF